MAVKIIKAGMKKKHEPIEFKCCKCGCVFTADDENDYEEEFSVQCGTSYLKIDCPCCGHSVIQHVPRKVD